MIDQIETNKSRNMRYTIKLSRESSFGAVNLYLHSHLYQMFHWMWPFFLYFTLYSMFDKFIQFQTQSAYHHVTTFACGTLNSTCMIWMRYSQLSDCQQTQNRSKSVIISISFRILQIRCTIAIAIALCTSQIVFCAHDPICMHPMKTFTITTKNKYIFRGKTYKYLYIKSA